MMLKVDPTDARIVEKLEDLPGMKLGLDGRIIGAIDVQAAVAKRLGRKFDAESWAVVKDEVVPDVPLREYQKDGLKKLLVIMLRSGGALLADDMGLGKTRQAAALSLTLAPNPEDRVFIVCPASVRETWREELTKIGVLEERIAILGPRPTKKAEAEWDRSPEAHFVVTSYELAERAMEHAFMLQPPTFLIFDEAQEVKGRKNKQRTALKTISAMTPYKLALTGSPIWDRPRDLYSLLNILLGGTFGSAFDFDVAYCGGKLNEHGGLDNKGATRSDELKLRLSYYMVRREKKDVLDELPPLQRQVIWCDSDPKARAYFQSAMIRKAKGDTQKALETCLLGKAQVAVDLAVKARRFLLFTWKRDHAHQLGKMLLEQDTPCVVLTGDVPAQKRSADAKLAAAKGWGVVATLDSLSVGVNLQSVATTGIFHAIDYVPQKMAQAEARLHRMGQSGAVTWYYVAMKDTMDELVVRTVVHKLEQWSAVMGKGQMSEMRDKLNAAIGVGEEAEKAALKALYDSMGDDE